MAAKLLPVLLAVAAGFAIVIQQALNAKLHFDLGSAAWSGFASYLVGLLCMILFVLAMREPVPSGLAARLPWWAWSGGLFCGLYIVLAILLVPQLGAATFVGLVVAGQMLASIAFDHFGLFGLAQRPLDLPRLIGVALLVGRRGADPAVSEALTRPRRERRAAGGARSRPAAGR